MAEMSPLRRRMIEDMTVRNLSPATQRSYLHAVSRFSRGFKRSSQRRLCWLIEATGQASLQAFSNQASFGAGS